jgi:hypothetical protein
LELWLIELWTRGHCKTTIRNFMLPCGEMLANLKANTSHKPIPTCSDLWSQVHSCKLWSSYIDYWYVYVNNLQCEHLFTNLLSYIGCVVSWFFKFPVFVSHCIRIVLYIWASSYITKAKLFTFFSLLSHHHCFSNCILNSVVQSSDIFGTMFITS